MPLLTRVTVVAYNVNPIIQDVPLDKGILCFYKNSLFRDMTNFPETRLCIFDVYQQHFESIPTFAMMEIDPLINPLLVVRNADFSDEDCLGLVAWTAGLTVDREAFLLDLPYTVPSTTPTNRPLKRERSDDMEVSSQKKSRKRNNTLISDGGDLMNFTQTVPLPSFDAELEVTTCVKLANVNRVVEVIDLTTDD